MRVVTATAIGLVLACSWAIWTYSRAVDAAQQQSGREVFRYDTFGDEQLWTKTLRMQEALRTVNPETALSVGLKVDADALPKDVLDAIKAKKVDLKDPAVTLQLLKANSVVGVKGVVSSANELTSVGITCALCHSTVDDSVGPGIGKRLDGYPNVTLNVGAIIGLSPALDAATKAEFGKWGPGRYDPRHHVFDGTAIKPLNAPSIPVVLPPAYGLKDVGFETFTADGPVSYWNNYVAVTQMGGHGTFSDPRINVSIKQAPDQVAPKLDALRDYQFSLKTPTAPNVDRIAAKRGEAVFHESKCATCHVPPTYTDVQKGPNAATPKLHSPADVGADPAYAERSATKMYRATPLRGLWQHPPYFHDGSAADLNAVVARYEKVLKLTLTPAQKADLVAFLKSL
jgi:cytochrome c551/c552